MVSENVAIEASNKVECITFPLKLLGENGHYQRNNNANIVVPKI